VLTSAHTRSRAHPRHHDDEYDASTDHHLIVIDDHNAPIDDHDLVDNQHHEHHHPDNALNTGTNGDARSRCIR